MIPDNFSSLIKISVLFLVVDSLMLWFFLPNKPEDGNYDNFLQHFFFEYGINSLYLMVALIVIGLFFAFLAERYEGNFD